MNNEFDIVNTNEGIQSDNWSLSGVDIAELFPVPPSTIR